MIGSGGVAAAVGAALRGGGRPVVQVQHPRMDPRRFDLIVVNRHDELTGPNVVVTRTALHRVTPARLAEAAAAMASALRAPEAAIGRGAGRRQQRAVPTGCVGRRRSLPGQLAAMMRRDGVGVAVTPSRRTDPAVTRVLTEALAPLGGYVWDGSGDNPYFGMLALADAIVVTMDSVSMVSEAVATAAPVMLAALPGRSRRNRLFTDVLLAEGRVREFAGRYEAWPVAPLDDTPRSGGRDVPAARHLVSSCCRHCYERRDCGNLLPVAHRATRLSQSLRPA